MLANSLPKLTAIQEKALKFIHRTTVKRGTPPTLRELCEHMGYKAIGSAQDVVSALRKKQYLIKPKQQSARSLSLTNIANNLFHKPSLSELGNLYTVPCLGSVPAGNPVEAVEERIGNLTISPELMKRHHRKPKHLFALKAQGWSMRDAAISDGDWLIVRQTKEAEKGQIVVARLEDEATVKRLMHDKKRGFFLKPENPDFKNIYGDENPFEVIGEVVALQRMIV